MRWGKAGDVTAGGKQLRLEGYEDGTNLEKWQVLGSGRGAAGVVLFTD